VSVPGTVQWYSISDTQLQTSVRSGTKTLLVCGTVDVDYVHLRILSSYRGDMIPFWIVPGRCITWEIGGSQFTMTLWMGYAQTTKNDNGNPPKPAGGRQVPDPTMTEHGICPGPSICYIYSGIK
jgi:hypothetical protein